MWTFYYCPQRSCGNVMFSQACVKNSIHRGGLCPSMHHRSHDWGSQSRAASVQGSLCPGESLSRGVSVQGSLCPGESLSNGGLCPGVSVWGSLFRGVSVQGVLCPGGLFPGASLSRGSLSSGSLSRGVSVQEGLCPGRSLSWGISVQGVSVRKTSPQTGGNERVVRILLECILVMYYSRSNVQLKGISEYEVIKHVSIILIRNSQCGA